MDLHSCRPFSLPTNPAFFSLHLPQPVPKTTCFDNVVDNSASSPGSHFRLLDFGDSNWLSLEADLQRVCLIQWGAHHFQVWITQRHSLRTVLWKSERRSGMVVCWRGRWMCSIFHCSSFHDRHPTICPWTLFRQPRRAELVDGSPSRAILAESRQITIFELGTMPRNHSHCMSLRNLTFLGSTFRAGCWLSTIVPPSVCMFAEQLLHSLVADALLHICPYTFFLLFSALDPTQSYGTP